MAETRFHSLLRVKIDEAVNVRSGSMASGACPDYPSYRENVGYIKGLIDALNLADEIEKEYE